MQIPFGHARVLLVIASLGFAACGMPDHAPDEDTDEIAAAIGDPAGNIFRGNLADRAAFAFGQDGQIDVAFDLLRAIK